MTAKAAPASGLRILRKIDVARKLGVHHTTPMRWANDARYAHMGFPRPVQIGEGCVGFIESEIDAWVLSRPRAAWAERAA